MKILIQLFYHIPKYEILILGLYCWHQRLEEMSKRSEGLPNVHKNARNAENEE